MYAETSDSSSLSTATDIADPDLHPHEPPYCQRCPRRIEDDNWGLVPKVDPETGWDQVCSLCCAVYTVMQLSRSHHLGPYRSQELESRLLSLIDWLQPLAEPPE